MKLLLDTNFLMLPGQLRIDVYGQLRSLGRAEFYATNLSVSELERLATNRGRKGAAARVALMLLKKEGVKIVQSGRARTADEAIARIARREGMLVCTADKRLKRRLEARGTVVITPRQGKYIELE